MGLLKVIRRLLARRSLSERLARLSDRLEDTEHLLTFARQELCRLEGRPHKDKRAIRKKRRSVEKLQRVVDRLQRVVDRLGPFVAGH